MFFPSKTPFATTSKINHIRLQPSLLLSAGLLAGHTVPSRLFRNEGLMLATLSGKVSRFITCQGGAQRYSNQQADTAKRWFCSDTKQGRAERLSKGIRSMSLRRIGCLGSSTFRPSTPTVSMSLTVSRFSSELPLRPFHHGISQDEVEQSIGRPCRQLNGRSKRHCEST